MNAPQGLFQVLATISVAIAGAAIKNARDSGQRLHRITALETEHAETKKKVEAVAKQQIEDGKMLAIHDHSIGKIEVHIGSINSKLESLPRLTTLLETIAPQLVKLVPREEIEERFKSVHEKIDLIKG